MLGPGISLTRCMRPLAVEVAAILQNYDASIWGAAAQYLYQESTGVTPVSAVEQPVGLDIDYGRNGGLGAELIPLAVDREFTSETGYWSKGAGWSIGSGVASITVSAGTNVISRSLGTTGKLFQITYTVASVGAQGFTAYCGGTLGPVHTSAGTYTVRLVCGSTNTSIGIAASAAGTTGTIDSISIKLLDGYHGTQSSAPARPTFRRTANGIPYKAMLGTDDHFVHAIGGGGNAGMFYGAVMRPTGGAGTSRYLLSDAGANTGYIVALSAADKLSINAGNGTAYTGNPSTETISVGSTYSGLVWDDGSNLNTRVNSGGIVSAARPVVVAGTTSMTRGRANGTSSNYNIADVFIEIYIRNACPTPAEIAKINQFLESIRATI